MSEKLPKNAAKKPANYVNSSAKVIDDMSSDGFEFHSSYANVITNRDGSREVLVINCFTDRSNVHRVFYDFVPLEKIDQLK